MYASSFWKCYGTCKKCALLTAVLITFLSAVCAGAESFVRGASFQVPDTWERQERPLVGTEWAATERSTVPKTLQVLVRREYTPISPLSTTAVQADLHRQLVKRSGIETPRVDDLRYVEVAGFPAYRLRVSLEKGEQSLEQLIYVVGADKTFVFTFCTSRSDYATDEREFETVMGSLHVSTHLALALPPWACGIVLCGCAGLSAALRRRIRS